MLLGQLELPNFLCIILHDGSCHEYDLLVKTTVTGVKSDKRWYTSSLCKPGAPQQVAQLDQTHYQLLNVAYITSD